MSLTKCPLVSLQELESAGWALGHANLPLRQVGDLGLAWGHLLTQDTRMSWWAGLVWSTEGGHWFWVVCASSQPLMGGHSPLGWTGLGMGTSCHPCLDSLMA